MSLDADVILQRLFLARQSWVSRGIQGISDLPLAQSVLPTGRKGEIIANAGRAIKST